MIDTESSLKFNKFTIKSPAFLEFHEFPTNRQIITAHIKTVHELQKTSIFFGNQYIADAVKEIFKDNHLITVSYDRPKSGPWIRDTTASCPFSQVLMQGYLPSDMQKTFDLARTLFPDSCKYNILTGHGVIKNEENKVDSLLVIEGGNIKFWTKNNQNGAFIGSFSVILTLQKLEESQYFTEERMKSRCLNMYQYLHQNLINPELEKKWNLTLKFIAEKLNLKVENLIVLEHLPSLKTLEPRPHIDIDMTLDCDNNVYLNSPLKVLEAWENVDRGELHGFEYAVLKSMRENKQAVEKVFKKNKDRIKSADFNICEVPGYFETHEGGFLLNGLMFHTPNRDKLFLTSSMCSNVPSCNSYNTSNSVNPRLINEFDKSMLEHNVQVIYQDCCGQKNGGIHCLSRTEGLIRAPQSIPMHTFPLKISTIISVNRPDYISKEKMERILQDNCKIQITESGNVTEITPQEIVSDDRKSYLKIDIPLKGADIQVLNGESLIPLTESFHVFPGNSLHIHDLDKKHPEIKKKDSSG